MTTVGVLSSFELVAVYPFPSARPLAGGPLSKDRRQSLIAEAAQRVVRDRLLTEIEAQRASYILEDDRLQAD